MSDTYDELMRAWMKRSFAGPSEKYDHGLRLDLFLHEVEANALVKAAEILEQLHGRAIAGEIVRKHAEKVSTGEL